MSGIYEIEEPVAGPPKKQPKNRLHDPDTARGLIRYAQRALEPQQDGQRMVSEAYDRMPPDDPVDLFEDGVGHGANLCWGGMEREIDSAVSPLYNLASQPDQYVKLRTTYEGAMGAHLSPHKQLDFMAQADKEMMDDWGSWHYELEKMLHFRKAYGLGIFYFRQPHGWHFSALHPGNLIYPEDAPVDQERWSWVAVRTGFDVVDLLEKLRDPKTTKAQGYDLANVREAIRLFSDSEGARWLTALDQDAEYYVENLRPNDLGFGKANNRTIPGWILYVQEWGGGISEHMVPDMDNVGYLYSGLGRHRKFSDVISLFPDTLGQGVLKRVRGLGVKTLAFHSAQDRLMNQTLDVTHLGSSMLMQGGSPDDLSRAREISMGPVTYLPDNVSVLQQSFSNPAQGLVALMELIDARREEGSAAYGGGAATGDKQKTYGEARMDYQEGKSLEDFDKQRFYCQLDRFHSTRFKRAFLDPIADIADPGMKGAAYAVSWASTKGLEPQTLFGIDRIRSQRLMGDGNPVNTFLALKDVAAFEGGFSEQGKRAFRIRALTARLNSRELAEEFMGTPGLDDYDSDQRNEAQGENAAFSVSDQRIDVGGTDNALIHAGEHTIFAEEVIARADIGEIPLESAVPQLLRVQSHMSGNTAEGEPEAGHFEQLASDPMAADVWEAFRRRWAAILNSISHLSQNLQAKQQAEAKQQQEAAMEEMKNPTVPVKDRETAMTEEIRRQSMIRETDAKIAREDKLAGATIKVMNATAQTDHLVKMAQIERSGATKSAENR